MTHTEQSIQHHIYSQLRIMLIACGFEVRQNSFTDQYQVEGTIENAAEFFKLTVAGVDASSPTRCDEGILAKATAAQEVATCSCPSGDGSLRWPCAAHPVNQAPSEADTRKLATALELAKSKK